MKKLNGKYHPHLLLAMLGGGLFIVLSYFLLSTLMLEVWDPQARKLLFSFPVKKGSHFFLQYTHSTAKTVVEEHYQVAGPNDIILNRMVYSSGGAGIPDFPPPGARFMIGPDGRFVMDNISKHFPSLSQIRVAFFNPFLLGLEGKFYSLSQIARGRLVDIRVRYRVFSLLNRLFAGRER